MGAIREIIDIDLHKSSKHQVAKGDTDMYSFKGTTHAQLLMMDESLGTMAKSIGGLIRVKATGLPLGYDLIFFFVFFGEAILRLYTVFITNDISLTPLSFLPISLLVVSILYHDDLGLECYSSVVHTRINGSSASSCKMYHRTWKCP